MMTRRGFLQRLIVGAAVLQLRFAPASAKTLGRLEPVTAPIAMKDDDGMREVAGRPGFYSYHGNIISAFEAVAVVRSRLRPEDDWRNYSPSIPLRRSHGPLSP